LVDKTHRRTNRQNRAEKRDEKKGEEEKGVADSGRAAVSLFKISFLPSFSLSVAPRILFTAFTTSVALCSASGD
jgi:hypothetical protein